jgi:hypothetical protein
MKLGTWIGVFAAAVVPAVATAQQPAGAPDSEACKPDVEKYCKDVVPGEGRLFKCLAGHLNELSPGCLQAAHAGHKAMHGNMPSLRDQCGKDIELLCKNIEPGQRALVDCLANQRVALTPQCRTVIDQKASRSRTVEEACSADIEKFCRKVAEVEGVSKCLGRNAADLTPGCRSTIFPHGLPPAMMPKPAPAAEPAAK